MFVPRIRAHDVVRQWIDKQETREQISFRLAATDGQPEPGEGESRFEEIIHVAGNHEIIATYDGRLRRRNPEIHRAFERKKCEPLRMLPDELASLLAALAHKANLTEILKFLHGVAVVGGMFLACPESFRLTVV